MNLRIKVMYGTESGESEVVADEISEMLPATCRSVAQNMDEIQIDELDVDAVYLIVCSTYGDGEVPATARALYAELSEKRPDLRGMRYAMFGRGDSTYETYLQGSRHFDALLTSLGATRVGEYGQEDAADWQAPEDLGIRWAESVVAFLEAEKVSS